MDGPRPTVEIRPWREGDAGAVHAIHCACLTGTLASRYTAEQIAAWMRGRTAAGYVRAAASGERLFVAEVDGRVAAFASWQDDELLALFVHPDMQRRGVGSDLLRACRDDAAALGGAITLVKAALGGEGFYARHGFVAVGPGGGTVKHGVAIPDTRMVLAETSKQAV